VPRTRLTTRLRASSSYPVVAVTAPAGYGKTTLLAQWSETARRPFAWVSLDEGDDDTLTLLTYVALALNRLEPLGAPVFDALSGRRAVAAARVLPRLCDALATRKKPFVVVLDDVHLLTSEESRAAISTLIRHLPVGSQLVLAGRGEEPVPLARLRANGMLFELHAADLAFDLHGTQALLRAMGITLHRDELELIAERTEGWPAGLYLAALALRSQGSLAAAIDAFSGDDAIVADYFRNEVLARQTPAVARFMTRSSILERLSGPLCDAVVKTRGSTARLRELEQSNLFLIPLDRQQVWYRYHTLFAEKLRARLQATEPELEPELHRRASRWYAEHAEPDQAIRHARAAGDVELAGDLVWANVCVYKNRGRQADLERWLAAFEDEQIAAYPPLALAAAWTALGYDADGVERWTDAAARSTCAEPLSDGTASLSSALALLAAVIANDGVVRMGDDAAFVREHEQPSSPWQASACLLEGASLRLTGNSGRARELFLEGERVAAARGLGAVRALCLGQLAQLAMERKAWARAQRFVAAAGAEADAHGLQEDGTLAPVYATSALLLARNADADAAHGELRRARSLLAGSSQVTRWFEIEGRLLLAETAVLLADWGTARTLLAEARSLAGGASSLGLLAARLAELSEAVRASANDGHRWPSALTTAELRLLHYLPTHLNFREIGNQLHLSRNTVKSQAMSIYRKLDASSRSEAVECARSVGLITD
jgi:LuxR family maltose regulon positive regulatory protein